MDPAHQVRIAVPPQVVQGAAVVLPLAALEAALPVVGLAQRAVEPPLVEPLVPVVPGLPGRPAGSPGRIGAWQRATATPYTGRLVP